MFTYVLLECLAGGRWLQIKIFFVATPCEYVDTYECLGKACFLHLQNRNLFNSEDGAIMFLRYVGIYQQVATALQPRRQVLAAWLYDLQVANK
jgi:hypothetical protein